MCLVTKIRNDKVKRLWTEMSVKLQAIGRRNGSPLIGNAKGEEIVYSHPKKMCCLLDRRNKFSALIGITGKSADYPLKCRSA